MVLTILKALSSSAVVKIPDLEKLIEFTSADLSKIAQNVLKAHKDDVRKNAKGPKGKFKELSNKPLKVYDGLSYKQYKQKKHFKSHTISNIQTSNKNN